MPAGAKGTVVVHHDGINRLTPQSTREQEREVMRIFEDYHAKNLTQSNPRIGYQFVLMPSARIYEGVGWKRIGAHVSGHNSEFYGICFAGNGANTRPSAECVSAFVDWRIEGVRLGFISLNHIVKGHQDFNKPSCPGKLVYETLVENVMPLGTGQPRVVWSDYYSDYLVVTRVVNDNQWYFVPLRVASRMEQRAHTPLSQMKTQP
jgi:hypothetical protein